MKLFKAFIYHFSMIICRTAFMYLFMYVLGGIISLALFMNTKVDCMIFCRKEYSENVSFFQKALDLPIKTSCRLNKLIDKKILTFTQKDGK